MLKTAAFVAIVTVIGCADIVAPEGVVVRRHSRQNATITCSASGTQRSWDVSCQNDRWVVPGALHLSNLLSNCTQLLPGTQPAIINLVADTHFHILCLSTTDMHCALYQRALRSWPVASLVYHRLYVGLSGCPAVHASVRLCPHVSLHLCLANEWRYFNETVSQLTTTLMTLRVLLVQRSRSATHHRVNAVGLTRKPMKGFRPNLTQHFLQSDYEGFEALEAMDQRSRPRKMFSKIAF